ELLLPRWRFWHPRSSGDRYARAGNRVSPSGLHRLESSVAEGQFKIGAQHQLRRGSSHRQAILCLGCQNRGPEMFAWDAIGREVGAVTPDRQASVSEIQLYIISLRTAHPSVQFRSRSPLNTDLVAPIIFFAPPPDVPGELRRQ